MTINYINYIKLTKSKKTMFTHGEVQRMYGL